VTADLDSLPFHDGHESPPTRNGATGKPRCRRHEWVTCGPDYLPASPYGHPEDYGRDRCQFCLAFRDPAASRRGRSSDRLGKDQERRIERVYGPRKVGEFGDAVDHLGRDFKWQAKATRSLPPKWLANILMPTFREQVPQSIWRAAGHMKGIGGTRRPLVIRSYVRQGVATRDWLFVGSWDWLQLHGVGMTAGWIVLPGSDFLDLHGRDEP
jgi:hypothetical protein